LPSTIAVTVKAVFPPGVADVVAIVSVPETVEPRRLNVNLSGEAVAPTGNPEPTLITASKERVETSAGSRFTVIV
jgi:hypothetical protein